MFDPMQVEVGFVHLFTREEPMPAECWSYCEGQDMDVQQYPVLFSKIGYTFGGEKGSFKLPDFRLKQSLDPAFVEMQSADFIVDKYGIRVK